MSETISTGDPAGAMVLVADDDDDLRALVLDALRADGYRVRGVRNGVQMLAVVAETLEDPEARPDVLVIDAQMPELSGFGVLEELRRTHVRTPALMISGFHPASVAMLARRLGAVAVLKKPFDLAQLREAVIRARDLLP
jgi:DNA-binding response OmpR family regulator